MDICPGTPGCFDGGKWQAIPFALLKAPHAPGVQTIETTCAATDCWCRLGVPPSIVVLACLNASMIAACWESRVWGAKDGDKESHQSLCEGLRYLVPTFIHSSTHSFEDLVNRIIPKLCLPKLSSCSPLSTFLVNLPHH